VGLSATARYVESPLREIKSREPVLRKLETEATSASLWSFRVIAAMRSRPARARASSAVEENDDAGFAEARVLEALVGEDALGPGVVGAERVEVLGTAGAECGRGPDYDRGDDQYSFRSPSASRASHPIIALPCSVQDYVRVAGRRRWR
jgi:hypothetical protein